MATNGRSVVLTKSEKRDFQKKIDSFINMAEFCEMNKIQRPVLDYPLKNGKCSQKTYELIISSKYKKEISV